jgi:spore maturation protein CgeB
MKILFLSDSYMQDGFFDPFRQEVLETLSLYGSETKAIITNHFLRSNSSSILFSKKFGDAVRTIKDFNPDVVFSINRAGLVQSLIDVISPNAVRISWFIDSYERVCDSLLTFTEKEIVWLTGEDTYAENFCNKYKIERERIVTSPFAANTNIFYPHNKKREIDGCFVGTAFSHEPFVDTLNNLCKDTPQKDIFLSVFESHKQKYIFNLQAFLEEKGFEKYSEKPRDIWQVIFDDQISTEKRVQMLSALNEFNIRIYGEPDNLWIKYLSISNSSMLSKYQYQPIKTANELSDLYNISKIGINIQHHQASNHSLPIRVFDLMACKTLLLTEKQSVNALNQIGFVENIDFVCFKDREELREKFNFYLIHEKERNRIIDSAYLKIAKYHSLKFRIQNGLAQSLGTSTILKCSIEGKLKIISKPDNLKIFPLSSRSKYFLILKKKFPKIWEFFKLIAIKSNILRW